MRSQTKTQPNFFIAGAPKAGTTSLYHYLKQHPQIYMSPIKEPNYFAAEVRPGNFAAEFRERASRDANELQQYLRGPVLEPRFGGIVPEWEQYLRLFEDVNGETAIGEASVCYLWSKTAARNIFEKAPDARILLILRNPAERAFSQYLHAVSNGLVRESFRKQIQMSLRRRTEGFGILNPFLELGLYFEQVKRFLEIFSANNVRIYLYEDYQKQRASVLAEIFRFLDIDQSFVADTSQKYLESRIPKSIGFAYALKRYGVWRRLKEMSPLVVRSTIRSVAFKERDSLVMDPETRASLTAYYEKDVRRLSSLLGRDLTAWLS